MKDEIPDPHKRTRSGRTSFGGTAKAIARRNRKTLKARPQQETIYLDEVCQALLSDQPMEEEKRKGGLLNFTYVLGKGIGEETEGTFVILRFAPVDDCHDSDCEAGVVEYGMVLEDKSDGTRKDAEKLGLPGGTKDEADRNIVDVDIFATASREVGEEMFSGVEGIDLTAKPEDLIGTIRKNTHSTHVIMIRVPHSYKHRVMHGPEQKDAFTATAEEINDYVRKNDVNHSLGAESVMFYNHVKAWKMYLKFAAQQGITL